MDNGMLWVFYKRFITFLLIVWVHARACVKVGLDSGH